MTNIFNYFANPFEIVGYNSRFHFVSEQITEDTTKIFVSCV